MNNYIISESYNKNKINITIYTNWYDFKVGDVVRVIDRGLLTFDRIATIQRINNNVVTVEFSNGGIGIYNSEQIEEV